MVRFWDGAERSGGGDPPSRGTVAEGFQQDWVRFPVRKGDSGKGVLEFFAKTILVLGRQVGEDGVGGSRGFRSPTSRARQENRGK